MVVESCMLITFIQIKKGGPPLPCEGWRNKVVALFRWRPTFSFLVHERKLRYQQPSHGTISLKWIPQRSYTSYPFLDLAKSMRWHVHGDSVAKAFCVDTPCAASVIAPFSSDAHTHEPFNVPWVDPLSLCVVGCVRTAFLLVFLSLLWERGALLKLPKGGIDLELFPTSVVTWVTKVGHRVSEAPYVCESTTRVKEETPPRSEQAWRRS